MEVERKKLETDIEERIQENFVDAQDGQATNVSADIRVVLSEHMDAFEELVEMNQKNLEEMLKTIETHGLTIKEIEENSKFLFNQVSELEKYADMNGSRKNDRKYDARFIKLESHVDSLTEKVNNFVQNVMIVRSLPQKVMDIQNKLTKLENKMKF